jgi:hypothetical protein
LSNGPTRRDAVRLVAGGSTLLLLPAARGLPAVAADGPRVEWRTDPVGIDTMRPRFRWCLRADGAVEQAQYRIVVIGDAGSGADGRTIADSGWQYGTAPAWRPAASLRLVSHAAYRWALAIRTGDGREAAMVPMGRFVTGIVSPGDWRAAWIAAGPEGAVMGKALEWRRPMQDDAPPLPILRHAFDVPAGVRAAFLSVVGLGQYDIALDGDVLTEGELRPAWSDFSRTIHYDSFDVTRRLRPGRVVLSAMLGNGFFNVEGMRGRYTKLVGSQGRPRLLFQLRLILADGSDRTIVSDAGWRWAPGPITFSSLYGGEDHDASRERRDWRTAAAPPPGFAPVHILPAPHARLVAAPIASVKVMRRIERPVIVQAADGRLVADFGINFAGRPRIALRNAAAGQRVTMKPAELLTPAGGIDQMSMTGARIPGYHGIAFSHTARGGDATWSPRFTYTGFRYLEVEGARRDQVAALTGDVLHLDVPRTGRFACSDGDLMRVHGIIEQAFLSNLASVLTDCPHREKLGWLEQIHLNAPTAFYNRDCAALYEKIAADMRDAQQAGGMVPSIAPEYVAFVRKDGSDTPFRDSPEWGCAMVLAPWAAYRFYGDMTILTDNYAAMRRYAGYLRSRARDGIVDFGLGDWFDVGPNQPGEAQLTSKAFTGTATLYAVQDAMAQIAATLGHDADAASYRAEAKATARTIARRLFDAASDRYDRGSQTAQAMALALGIAPPARRGAVLARLIADIERRDHHVSAGDVGFHYVVAALTAAGRGDTLYRMLKRPDAPSYLAQITAGATALTEAWDAARHASQNHFMLGHAEAWLFGGLGGVGIDFADRDAPIRIAPQPVAGVAWSDVTLATVLGDVRCRWRRTGGTLAIDADIPAGAAARLTLPGTAASRRLRSGHHRFTIAA